MIDNANLNCAKRDAESRALLGEQSPSSLPSKHAKIHKSVGSIAEARRSASRCLSEKFPTDLADSSQIKLRLCFVCLPLESLVLFVR